MTRRARSYWRLRLGAATLLLMRKPPDIPVGLGVTSGAVEPLVRIAQAWGVERYEGWRWRLWWARRRLRLGRNARI